MTAMLLTLAGALSGLGEIGFLSHRFAAARRWVKTVVGWRIYGTLDGQHTYREIAQWIYWPVVLWSCYTAGSIYMAVVLFIVHRNFYWQVRNLFFHSGLVMRNQGAGCLGDKVYPDWSTGQRVMMLLTSIAEVVLWIM